MPKVEDDLTDKVESLPQNLDQLHQKTMSELEKGDFPTDDDESDDEADDSEEDDKDEADASDNDSSDDDDSDADSDDDDEEEIEEEAKPTPPPVVDRDTDKNGDGKITVKDSDGKTHYFNNLDEVPEEFEPFSYKEWGRAVQDFADKKLVDRETEKARVANENKAAFDKEQKEVIDSWDKDIAKMTKAGTLSKDEKARETEIADTYAYISKQLGDGIVIDSFAQAHKAMRYDQLQEEKAEKAKETADLKKKQGAKVMGGGGSNPGKPKVIEAMPAGMTLDQVHAKYAHLK